LPVPKTQLASKQSSQPVIGQQVDQLRRERDVADGGTCLRRHSPRWLAPVSSRELRGDVQLPLAKVNITPDQAEQLGGSKAGVERGGDHRRVARCAGIQKPVDLRAAEHSLSAALRTRTL